MSDFFHFPATAATSSVEAAGRFSDLSKAGRHRRFIKTISDEYPWISDINVEVHAGAPTLFATVRDNGLKLPLANLSGGLNRMVSMMLAIAANPKAIVLVDEIE